MNNQKNFTRGAVVVLGLTVIGLGGTSFILNDKLNQTNSQLHERNVTIDKQMDEIQLHIQELETLKGEYEKMAASNAELEANNGKLRKGNAELGNRIASLNRTIANLKYKRNLSRAESEKLKAEIAQFKADLLAKNQEVAQLQLEKDSLSSSLENMTTTNVHMSMELDALAERVGRGSVLKANDIQISSIDAKGKERQKTTYKTKHLDKVKVAFNLDENNVAEHGSKEMVMRILDPNGAVIYSMTGADAAFQTAKGEQAMYTSRQLLNFDNSGQKVSFLYDSPSDLNSGQYTIELYAEGHPIGTSSFEVK